MTLFSLASRQIWPQVLAVLHTRPTRLVLFHSEEETESRRPAERLQDLFQGDSTPHRLVVELRRIPHDRYRDVVDAFADAAHDSELDETNCQVHLTGGNKLMAMAAAEWCRLAGIPCFYLERDLRVFPFLPRGNDILPGPDFKLDAHLARQVEPLALLRCQLDAADIVSPGQRLTLNLAGQRLPDDRFQPLLHQGHDFREFLAWDVAVPDREQKFGFHLEYATAVALLKLGVPVVQRSVALAPRVIRGSGLHEGELDLVFNWAGKLWVVDCKDHRAPDDKVEHLRRELSGRTRIDETLAQLLDRLAEELRERELHPLKADLLAVGEVGGLLGRAICVRRQMQIQAIEFARSRRIDLVRKDHLLCQLRPLLFPDEPASLDQLRSLAATRSRATS